MNLLDFVTKESNKLSVSNMVNALAFLLGVADIVSPYIPEEFKPLLIVGVAVVNLYLRTFQTDGSPIVAVRKLNRK